MSYEHFNVVVFYIANTYFKIKISIKAYEISLTIFLPLNLIIGKFTLVLKLTSQNVFCWTQICYDVR
jgi:hypothetical protein